MNSQSPMSTRCWSAIAETRDIAFDHRVGGELADPGRDRVERAPRERQVVAEAVAPSRRPGAAGGGEGAAQEVQRRPAAVAGGGVEIEDDRRQQDEADVPPQ